MGIKTVADLMEWPVEYMRIHLGKGGESIYYLIRGIDNREIETERNAKSYGRENTLKEDTNNISELNKHLEEFAIAISYSLRVKELYAKTITVKIKTSDFATHTKSKTLIKSLNMSKSIYKEGEKLLLEMDIKDKVRLIGLSASNISDGKNEQMSFVD